MSNLVVCPKAGECLLSCLAGHKKPHEENGGCVSFGLCPPCVPVKPEVKEK